MKTFLTIFLSLAILSIGTAQTTRRVNNNVGISGTNVYATAQAAHDAAVANDIIVIDPSTTTYADLTLTKPLKIYGNGYYLDTNTDLKADQRSTSLGNVYFNTGSGGSEMYGIVGIGGIYIHGVSNITISRNSLPGNTGISIGIYNSNKANTIFTNVTNIIITRNHIAHVTLNGTGGYTISNGLVNNNIIGYLSGLTDPIVQNWVIRNNTFTSSASSTSKIVNSVFENNFFQAGGTSLVLTNVTSSYNVSTAVTFSGGMGNVNSYDYVTNSELVGTGAGISADEALQIKAGSPLKTLGSSSSEVGAFGGTTPYIISGIPPIPSITGAINTGTGDATTPIKVTISVKSNN